MPEKSLHLSTLGRRRRGEAHFTAADQHESRHALVALDEIDRSFVQRDDEILGRDLEIARGERPVRVDPKLVQPFDRRQSFRADEAPRLDVAARRTPNVHAGGEDSRFPGRLDEELDDQACSRRRAVRPRAARVHAREAWFAPRR